VALIGVLANDPEVIILDEPSSNLDRESLDSLISVLKKLNKEGKTIIVVSHDLKFVNKLNGRLLVLENGNIKYDGDVNKGIRSIDKFTSMLVKEESYE
jgi:energy-coupling factor transport system ATP-binding protein